MKRRIIAFFRLYLVWTLLFALSKLLFIGYNHRLFSGCSLTDVLQVMGHGLQLDLAVAAYLMAVPALLLIVSVWKGDRKPLRIVARFWFLLAGIISSVAVLLNAALYSYWGFPLDSTPFFYFLSSPMDALASAPLWQELLAMLLSLALGFALAWLSGELFLDEMGENCRSKVKTSLVLTLLTAALFLPIRGGVTVSTNNTGKVFFSDNQLLNHAAVNPLFSLLESVSKERGIASQGRFMDDAEARRIAATMMSTRSDSTRSILRTRRPDIYIVIMESFSSELMAELGGLKDVAVNLDSIARQGLLFTNFYANSFRTDRGLVAILSGYPVAPTLSLMKYPRKSEQLPSVARSLRRVGYSTYYYYGGDADFSNMRAYLKSQGYEHITSDVNFPLSSRLSKWGVPDDLVFEKVLADRQRRSPQLTVIQTSSSHEPYDVPYHRLKDERLNAFAFSDHFIGKMLREMSHRESWQRTLVILVPDHLGAYPRHISNYDIHRYQIPLILTGGALLEKGRIDTYGSQQDIAATLLGQMGLAHDDFRFSKDLLSPSVPHFAFFTMPDLFGMATPEGKFIYDNPSRRLIWKSGQVNKESLRRGQAYLQFLYDDIDEMGEKSLPLHQTNRLW